MTGLVRGILQYRKRGVIGSGNGQYRRDCPGQHRGRRVHDAVREAWSGTPTRGRGQA